MEGLESWTLGASVSVTGLCQSRQRQGLWIMLIALALDRGDEAGRRRCPLALESDCAFGMAFLVEGIYIESFMRYA